MKSLWLGVDTGKLGAAALIDEELKIHLLEDYPGNEIELAKLVWKICDVADEGEIKIPLLAAIERSASRPILGGKVCPTCKRGQTVQGAKQIFSFGDNYGGWKTAMAMAGISFELPTPQAWKKGVVQTKEGKEGSMNAAARLFPDAEIYGPRGGRKDGRAEALLIAYWRLRRGID